MAQSKKSVLCLGISWGIMASQATRIMAYDIWGAKAKPWFGVGDVKNFLFNMRVTVGKYLWSLSENIFVLRTNILRVTANIRS
jgi:hypothetical protein